MRTVLLILGLTCVCLSADWQVLYEPHAINEPTIYIDSSSIALLSNGNIRAWLKWNYIAGSKDAQVAVSDVQYVEINVIEKMMTIIVCTRYYIGRPSYTETERGTGEWDYIVPDTIGEQVFSGICAFFFAKRIKTGRG